MPEQIRCPSCNAALRVPENLLGKNVKCPKCQKPFLAGMEELDQLEEIDDEPAPARRSEAMEEIEEESLEQEEEERPRGRKPPRRRRRDEDEDDRARRRRRAVELPWLDKQFVKTPIVLLVLFPMCCGWLALFFAIAGVVACQDARARQRALMVLIISIVWSILSVVILVAQRAAGH